jgi:hypothetical protein
LTILSLLVVVPEAVDFLVVVVQVDSEQELD